MRLIIAVALLAACAGPLAAETPPEWTGAASDLSADSYRGSTTISVDKPSVTVGEMFSVDVRFLNSGRSDEFYNPFLRGQSPRPAQLAIFSDDHQYLGDLLEREDFSQEKFGTADWTFVPSLCSVGCIEKLSAGYVPVTLEGGSRMLPPGEYYIQAIYCKGFLSVNPASLGRRPLEDEEKTFRQFEKNFDRTELFRSNVAKVRFTAK
jgi:hypothetical protein